MLTWRGLTRRCGMKLWQEWLSGETVVLVAERRARWWVSRMRGRSGMRCETADAEVYSLYLLRDAQGWGIGRALLKAIAIVLQQQRIQELALWVLERNRSRGFYERCGGPACDLEGDRDRGARLMEVAYWWPDLAVLIEAS